MIREITNGIWKITLGTPEKLTPVSVFGVDCKRAALIASQGKLPFSEEQINFRTTGRGVTVELPLSPEERIYGFGLQLKQVNQTCRKKHLRVNSDPVSDTGDSHAPVPFYVSTAGYGIFVDTARNATFYCGTNTKKGASTASGKAAGRKAEIADNTSDLYALGKVLEHTGVVIDIPAVKGVDLYVFGGPDMKTAVQRYNLFSGGGCLPPLWGLGVFYRAYGKSDQTHVLKLASELRDDGMPCDVLGLEPGWQSHSYSCSYQWDKVRFPDHAALLQGLKKQHYKVNLWEHVFVHPTADIYDELLPYSGDYEVWGGLVPDFATKEAEEIFGGYHKEKFINEGISGFKLDECDNSDYNITNWSFPDCAEFPSGLDGEQMHSLIGLLYQRTLYRRFQEAGMRTLSQVRSSYALASPYPFVLYSDLYDHKDFIRGVVNMGFSGLLWSPEVRDCTSAEDLIRRIQTVVYSPQALINAWTIPSPPWTLLNFEKKDQSLPLSEPAQVKDICKKLLETRMSLIPYLYSAFALYRFRGVPPFRALVMDYPHDPGCFDIDDEYMMGESMLVAPLVAGQTNRYVTLPEGMWCDFYTGQIYPGNQKYNIMPSIDRLPVFVKYHSVIPWSKPVQYVDDDTCFEITLRSYGGGSCLLYEDDGTSFDYENGDYNIVSVSVDAQDCLKVERTGGFHGKKYEIVGVERVASR